jgi:hypothetical protein
MILPEGCTFSLQRCSASRRVKSVGGLETGSWKFSVAPRGYQTGRLTRAMVEPGARTRGKPTSGGTSPAAAVGVKGNQAESGGRRARAGQTRPSAPAIRASDGMAAILRGRIGGSSLMLRMAPATSPFYMVSKKNASRTVRGFPAEP